MTKQCSRSQASASPAEFTIGQRVQVFRSHLKPRRWVDGNVVELEGKRVLVEYEGRDCLLFFSPTDFLLLTSTSYRC
jgi:hypothetical protein